MLNNTNNNVLKYLYLRSSKFKGPLCPFSLLDSTMPYVCRSDQTAFIQADIVVKLAASREVCASTSVWIRYMEQGSDPLCDITNGFPAQVIYKVGQSRWVKMVELVNGLHSYGAFQHLHGTPNCLATASHSPIHTHVQCIHQWVAAAIQGAAGHIGFLWQTFTRMLHTEPLSFSLFMFCSTRRLMLVKAHK